MNPEENQERDIIEFIDDDGNTMELELMDYFFYNGQEYAALCEVDKNPADDTICVMKVNSFTDEDGEEMEEFVAPEEALMEKLIRVARIRFIEGVDDEDDDEDEE